MQWIHLDPRKIEVGEHLLDGENWLEALVQKIKQDRPDMMVDVKTMDAWRSKSNFLLSLSQDPRQCHLNVRWRELKEEFKST
jgi:histidinol-phosphate/aromatic aminotransferase/cobyric acid decarboxylase-like protein